MDKRDKIKERIKALLSKTTENGATKHEMESALSKASQLMTDYFIAEHEITDDSLKEKIGVKHFPLIKSGFDLKMFFPSLAKLFDCEHYFNKHRVAFFGYQQDVELCGYFYNLITMACLNEKGKYLKSDGYKFSKQFYPGRSLSSSFIKGFLFEVTRKLQQMYADREGGIPKSYGLMVIEKRDTVKKSFESLDLKIKAVDQGPIRAEKEAFEDGVKRGEQINLVQGIESREEATSGRLMESNQ